MRCRRGLYLLATFVISGLVSATALAQDAVVITCTEGTSCDFRRAYSPSLNGQDSVRLLPVTPTAAAQPGKGRSARLGNLLGIFRTPDGSLRVMDAEGHLGDIVVPSKLPKGVTRGSAAAANWTIGYRDQPRSKTRASVKPEEFIALIPTPVPAAAAIAFVKHELSGHPRHPMEAQLVAAAVTFANGSSELQAWREEVRTAMRTSLDAFRQEAADPVRLEETLAAGVNAVHIHQRIAADPHQDEGLQQDLTREYQRLLERFAIGAAFAKADMKDPFLEELQQIGLARWSRPALVADVNRFLQASADAHHQRATELFNDGQYGAAFDEARLASSRAACNDEVNDAYYRARLEFVNRNMVPSLPAYDGKDKSVLEQIVRELQSNGHDAASIPERVEYIRKRIADGERLDKDYLPLQLEKAEFLAGLGELTAARDVVTHVERTARLSRSDGEKWLAIDASLNGKLLTLRQTTERLLTQQISDGRFKEALATAETGLRADPANPRFVYFSIIAAAVLREEQQTKDLATRYLRLMGSGCAGKDDTATVLEMYHRQPAQATPTQMAGKTPNWVSGVVYAPGEAFYDPISGSFNAHILNTVKVKDQTRTVTELRWEGFLVTSIQTTEGSMGTSRTVMELEPAYAPKGVHMIGIGPRANSAGRQNLAPLRYLNSPDIDPLLASRFTGKNVTRGWAGNPFFHPFLLNDVYLFDLVYDDLGRIKEAIPVPPDATHPASPFSEALTFTWDGASNRLHSISGVRYRREMFYDHNGRIMEEKITHPLGKGHIQYKYRGNSPQILNIQCEDNFYDRGERTIQVGLALER
jgi:hypothetical protein